MYMCSMYKNASAVVFVAYLSTLRYNFCKLLFLVSRALFCLFVCLQPVKKLHSAPLCAPLLHKMCNAVAKKHYKDWSSSV